MANREACELYIEQEIKEGLAQGKKPYSIGKELSSWVEKLFETSIPATTIEKRAERIKNPTNVGNPPTQPNSSEIPKNQTGRGGARDGAGRPPKYEPEPEPFTDAIHWATVAISQLTRIRDEDPHRDEALKEVLDYVTERRMKPWQPSKRK